MPLAMAGSIVGGSALPVPATAMESGTMILKVPV